MGINVEAIATEILAAIIGGVAHLAILLAASAVLSFAWSAIKWIFKKIRSQIKQEKSKRGKE